MEITGLLQRIQAGDKDAFDSLIPLVYGELKRLASSHLRKERKGNPLQTAELMHETFLRLARGRHPSYESRSQFYGIASRLMRQILVEMARARATGKRNGAEVPLMEIPDLGRQPDRALLLIDQALERLGQSDPLTPSRYPFTWFVVNCAWPRRGCGNSW